MRLPLKLFAASVLMISQSLSAGENPELPAPRTVDYDWMSVATWQQKHEANVARAARGGADILLLGDSITEGWQNTPLWAARFPKHTIANFGVGGDTTANVLWRLEHGELGALRPRLVVLLIGINNLGRNGDSPGDLFGGIQTIVGNLQSRLPGTKIIVLGVLPSDQSPDTKLRKKITKTNKLLQEKLHNGHTILVEDIGASVLEPDGTILPETMADFLHPTPAGYERLAAALFPKVERLLGAR